MKQGFIIAVIVTACQLLSPAAAQGMAYQWVDTEGVTHFSDTPPPADSVVSGSVKSIKLVQDHSTPVDPATDYYSIINQWKHMRAERIEREKLALEQERLRLQRSREERMERGTAAAQKTSQNEPVVVFGVARPFIYGRRAIPGRSQAFFHRSPQDHFIHRWHGARRTAPAQHHFGRRYTESASAGPIKFKCCR